MLQMTGSERENLVVAAVGLGTQPGLLEFTVPVATSTDILSARLRWVGRGASPTGDATILVNGHQRAGTLLAALNVGGSLPWVFFYEYDATTVARPGSNRWFVSGFNLGGGSRADGIGVLVKYRDASSPWTSILTVDPREFVSAGRGAVWEFPTGTSRDPRNARFVMLAGDCTSSSSDRVWWSSAAGPAPSELAGVAPNVLENRLASSAGSWMDLVTEDLVIPARASHFAYQIESPNDGAGDNIVHFFGALLSDGEGSFCTGSVAGRVWQDEDADGVEDVTEPGLGGVSVELRDAIGPVETASTDETGAFSFPALCAGDYVVTVDEATVPAGLRPTTCESGDCSPLTVALATDESAVSGIAFGWAEPHTPPSAGCFFGLGFWKHEYGVMTGAKNGRQHLELEVLAGLLRHVDEATALDWSRGDGSLDPSDAFAVLVENGATPCENAARHYFVALLNFAYNGAPSLTVDTNADGARDMTFGEAIETIEALFAQGGDDACREAKRIATSINATPSGECNF
jgi:hypothetical protein